jgi:hypothetical protein
MVGPQFQNGNLAEDVTNDGIVSTFDLLIVVNFWSTLYNRLLPVPGNTTVRVPPTAADYSTPLPTFDPTGGGQPGQGRFIDVDGNGVINTLDLIRILNYITANFNPGGSSEGEAGGEGEGESVPAARLAAPSPSIVIGAGESADKSSGDLGLKPVSLLAAPNIILEVRERAGSVDLGNDWLGDDGDDELFTTVAAAAARDEGSAGRVFQLDEQLRRRVPIGPLEKADWDDLLGELAVDVGGLPGDDDDA